MPLLLPLPLELPWQSLALAFVVRGFSVFAILDFDDFGLSMELPAGVFLGFALGLHFSTVTFTWGLGLSLGTVRTFQK